MSAKVLVVDDDESVRQVAALVLERAGFVVESVADGLGALRRLTDGDFDLVILDLMLPGLSGFDVCREVRTRSGVPILMLTARTDTTDVVAGLELGADDYVTKPFEPAELAARARAVLRRFTAAEPDVLHHHDLTIDERAHRVLRGDDEVRLTAIEFRLLTTLVRHAGQVLTREVLLERVWGYDYLGDSRLVDMAIKRVRDKLGDRSDGCGYISTVRSVGYRFDPD